MHPYIHTCRYRRAPAESEPDGSDDGDDDDTVGHLSHSHRRRRSVHTDDDEDTVGHLSITPARNRRVREQGAGGREQGPGAREQGRSNSVPPPPRIRRNSRGQGAGGSGTGYSGVTPWSDASSETSLSAGPLRPGFGPILEGRYCHVCTCTCA